MSSVGTGLTRKRQSRFDEDEDHSQKQPPATRMKNSFSNQRDGCLHCQGGSAHQDCHSCKGEWTGANGGCTTPVHEQPAEQMDVKPTFNDVVLNREPDCEASRRRMTLILTVENVIFNKYIPHPQKISVIQNNLRELLDLEDREAKGAIDSVKHWAQLEIDKCKNECRAAQEARSLLQGAHDRLQKSFVEIRAENKSLRAKPICQDLNVAAEGAEDFGKLPGNHGPHATVKQLSQSEILTQILSLTVELQKRSLQHESPGVSLPPGDAKGDSRKNSQELKPGHVESKPGEVSEEGPKVSQELKPGFVKLEPGEAISAREGRDLLDAAFSTSRGAVTKLQRAFLAVPELDHDELWDLPKGDVFAKPKHVAYYVKSVINFIFFDGFENESFNTCSGVSRFLDPDIRRAKFYEYYREGDVEGDPQFEEFCEMKGSELIGRIGPRYNGETVVSCLEEIGGPELSSSFIAAARSVWLLHKLAFSFEPPASIFSVQRGVDVDPTYMATVVKIADNERFISKVGFMIAPGLRLRKEVMPCEVYLLSETVPSSPMKP